MKNMGGNKTSKNICDLYYVMSQHNEVIARLPGSFKVCPQGTGSSTHLHSTNTHLHSTNIHHHSPTPTITRLLPAPRPIRATPYPAANIDNVIVALIKYNKNLQL